MKTGAVHITKGIMAEEISENRNVKLLTQDFRPKGTHPFKEFYGSIEEGGPVHHELLQTEPVKIRNRVWIKKIPPVAGF